MTKPLPFCLVSLLLAGSTYGQGDASFSITGVQTPGKQSVLKGVERDFFSPLSQELWDTLPNMLEVTFNFAPRRGNTDRLEDTFLLTVPDMGVIVAGKHYPAIAVKTSFGFQQKFPYNAMPDDSGNYCAMGCVSTMYFLVPRQSASFALTYRKASVAQSSGRRRR